MASTPDDLAPGAFRALGLIANPFRYEQPARETEYPGVKLVSHAAANQLLAAIDAAADDPGSRPIWVEKAGELPLSYYVTPLVEVLGVTGTDAPGMNVLTGYVPLDMMRVGRVRAVLSVFAERIAGVDVDLTIAAWMQRMLEDIDTDLAEYEGIGQSDLVGIAQALGQAPAATVERYFGPPAHEREGVEDLEVLMRISTSRQDALEADPDEQSGSSADDEAPTDALAEIFATPVGPEAPLSRVDDELAASSEGESEPDGTTTGTEPDDGLPRVDAMVAYVDAYTAAHLSPVIARALRAYRAQGISSMTQELKITKAPTKTLAALCRFAVCRYRKVVILFDRYDIWPSVPEDLRLKIIGTLSQLRHALRDSAVLVMMSATDQTPELEEQFAAASRVVWDMFGLVQVEGMEPKFDTEAAQRWLDSARLAGGAPIALNEEPLSRALPAEGALLAAAVDRLAAAIDDAVIRGVSAIDDAAVNAALEAVPLAD